ncbi:AbrB/MazE/SpoVT family DNA-binding domain-containing protein [Blastochloris tepida]|uniref:Transcriptional regulator n=1 Tax=Blastochloris tepida TaxID=2233851 RepID=A0A348G505_9HYPH|nr:AbrB/MazE/SpoVT family DNA-binding domain-containing protein [Blastochloris tepida]BBF94638.1 transcriptional regulator [Blastochloris tepida]
MKVEIKKIGNSTGVILPRELLSRLDLQRGDWLSVAEGPGKVIRLSPYDPDFEETVQIADQVMNEYRDTLKVLAK